MFKAMKAASPALKAHLEKIGSPNSFPSTLEPTKVEWERMQSMYLSTLLASAVVSGTGTVWDDAVMAHAHAKVLLQASTPP